MRHDPWTDEHERLLAQAAPPPTAPEASGADLERVWTRVGASIGGEDHHPRGRRFRIRAGVAAGLAAVVLGTSGLAAAAFYTAHTGHGPIDAEDLRLGGPGEKLQMAAPDYGEVIADATKDIPFPSETSRRLALSQQVDDARGSAADEFVSTGAVRAWVADAALCSWSNQWAAATRSGDAAARAQAITMIQAAPQWPAVVAIDPAPYSRMKKQQVQDSAGNVTTERYRDDSQFFYLGALGTAVQGGSMSAVAQILAANNGYCRAENVPDLPDANALHANAQHPNAQHPRR